MPSSSSSEAENAGMKKGSMNLAAAHPDRVAVELDFTEEREHQILAGADALLMPSLYEPCGLTQMKAMRYGTPPLARRVGGLDDTIRGRPHWPALRRLQTGTAGLAHRTGCCPLPKTCDLARHGGARHGGGLLLGTGGESVFRGLRSGLEVRADSLARRSEERRCTSS